MDHIVPPYGTKHLFKIPYICNTRFTFDEKDLLTYPVRCGMVTPELLSSEKTLSGALARFLYTQESTIDELAPFLQAWLYFGSLHFVFKTLIKADYQPNHFLQEEPDGQVVVTTQYLFEYILCWAAFESAMPDDEAFGLANVNTLLHLISDFLITLANSQKSHGGPFDYDGSQTVDKQSAGHLVFLSVVILYEVLEQAARQIYGHFADPFPGAQPLVTILKIHLMSAGWCPSEIGMLKRMIEISNTTAYFLTMIDRKSLKKDHSQCDSLTKCTAYDVVYETYETKHTHPSCACTFLPPIMSSVPLSISRIWDAGDIPLLTFHEEDGNEVFIKVTHCPRVGNSPIPRYVAISHVWSDGFGNQEDNSLPICVLKKMQTHVNRLFEPDLSPVPFWVDTICVPKSNKIPALEGMLDTYKKADIVLVLDASLEATTVYARPQEKLLRIAISPWMQRLWTLQEAWVTLNIAFQFQEEACTNLGLVEECICMPNRLKFDPEEFEARKTTSPLAKFANRIARAFGVDYKADGLGAFDFAPEDFLQTKELFKQKLETTIPGYPEKPDIRLAKFIHRSHLLDFTFHHSRATLTKLLQSSWRHRLSAGQGVAEVFQALQSRTTSRKEDEFYCLANLVNVPVTPILSVRPEDRMEKLLSSMKVVPSSIIFSMGVPRLRSESFTWAPVSFMGIAGGHYQATSSLACIHDKELNLTLPGLKLKHPLCRNNLQPVAAMFPTLNEPTGQSTNQRGYMDPIELLSSNPQDHWVYRLTLVSGNFSHETWKTYERFDLCVILSSSFEPTREGVIDGAVLIGALVAQIEAGLDVARVKYLETIYLQRFKTEETKPLGRGRYYEGEWTGEDHLWCIV